MIEAGTYRAIAVSGALGFTANGKEQVAVVFNLLDMNQQITWYGYFTEATEDRTMQALSYAGWDWVNLDFPEPPEVYLVIEHEEDQKGQTRAKVRWVNQATGKSGLKNEMTPEQAKEFAKRMQPKALEPERKLPF